MAAFKSFTKSTAVGVGIGVGIALATSLIAGDAQRRRRLLKRALRGYHDVREHMLRSLAEASEDLSDLIAEVHAEREAARDRDESAPPRPQPRSARTNRPPVSSVRSS